MTTLRQCLRMQRETTAKRHKRLINALPDALSEPSAATAKVWLEQCLVAERQATCRDHNAVMIELSRFIYGAPLDFDDTDDVEQDGPPPALACSRPPERCTRDNCEYVQHSSRGHAGFCCGTCRDPERHGRGPVRGHGYYCEHVQYEGYKIDEAVTTASSSGMPAPLVTLAEDTVAPASERTFLTEADSVGADTVDADTLGAEADTLME